MDYMYIFDVVDKEHLESMEEYAKTNSDYTAYFLKQKMEEIKFAKKLDRCMFWNNHKGTFQDTEFKTINRPDKDLIYFPRVIVNDYKIVYEDMEFYEMKPIVTPMDRFCIERWYKCLPFKFINRRIESFPVKNPLKDVSYMSLDTFFIKSLNRDDDFHRIFTFKEYNSIMNLIQHKISPNNEMLISEYIDITHEERCIFLDGKLKNEIRSDFESFTKSIGSVLGYYLPKNVVVDIAKLENGTFAVIECNCVTCADFDLEKIVR